MEAPPDGLVRSVIALANRARNAEPRGNLDAVLTARPPIYAMDSDARVQFAELSAWIQKHKSQHRKQGIAAIWGRAWEQSAKVALIIAASRSGDILVITGEDARFGIELARWSCASMSAHITVSYTHLDVYKRQAERFLTLLDEAAESFTFQTFDDLGSRKDKSLARILHGELASHVTDMQRLQWRRAGVYVTFNETDGKGRRLSLIHI